MVRVAQWAIIPCRRSTCVPPSPVHGGVFDLREELLHVHRGCCPTGGRGDLVVGTNNGLALLAGVEAESSAVFMVLASGSMKSRCTVGGATLSVVAVSPEPETS